MRGIPHLWPVKMFNANAILEHGFNWNPFPATVGAEIDGPRGVPWAVARRSMRPTAPPVQPAHGKQADGDQPPPWPYRYHPASDMPCGRRPTRLRSRTARALSWGWTSVRSKAIPARPGVSVSRPRRRHRCALEECAGACLPSPAPQAHPDPRSPGAYARLALAPSVDGQHHGCVATHDLPPHNHAHRATTRLTEGTAWAAVIQDRFMQPSFVCEGP
jgi:hypothetical protein